MTRSRACGGSAAPCPGRLPDTWYQTWYHVSGNRPGQGAADPPQALDLVFLPGLLAQAAGAPVDDWLAANIWARTQCAGLLEACRTPQGRETYLSYLRGDLGEFGLP